MKKNTGNTIRQLYARLCAWMHQWIEQKAAHVEECIWYPGPARQSSLTDFNLHCLPTQGKII